MIKNYFFFFFFFFYKFMSCSIILNRTRNLFHAPAPDCLCPAGLPSWSGTIFLNRTRTYILPLCKVLFSRSLHPLQKLKTKMEKREKRTKIVNKRKTQNVTKLQTKIVTKLKQQPNSNSNSNKTQVVIKLKNSNFYNTQSQIVKKI